MKIAALIPARRGSRRVDNKNMATINGSSLISRKIRQLKSPLIDSIFLGSDSREYLQEGEKYGAIPIERSLVACDESVSPANIMIEDFLDRIPNSFDLILWCHCTNPFLYQRQYEAAIQEFLRNEDKYDSLMSVEMIQNHQWDQHGVPKNYNPWAEKHTLASELEPVYTQTGGIFIQRYEQMKNNRYFFGKKPYLMVHDWIEAFDINTPEELSIAQHLAEYADCKEVF